MSLRTTLAAALAGAVCLVLPLAAVAQPSESSARRLALAIEQRAERTSFADLERFGEAAGRQGGREALRRLHHVAFTLLNQSEFDQFDHFNNLLAGKAQMQGDRRYAEIARIDALKSRYDRGDSTVADDIAHIADTETDWFAHASTPSASRRWCWATNCKAGEGVEAAVRRRDAGPHRRSQDAPAAEVDIWGTIGIELIQLNDLEGSAAAFQKADFADADSTYPRPDFDDVYNMTYLAVQLGDGPLARDLDAIHHRLASRSDLKHLDVWDKYLCAMVQDSFGAPAAGSCSALEPGPRRQADPVASSWRTALHPAWHGRGAPRPHRRCQRRSRPPASA